MESHDRPSGDASGTAAVRQTEQPSSAPEQIAAEEREARVAELRRQHQSGTYKVDAAELSSKIIDEHLKR